MSKFTGRLVQVGIAKEASHGAGATAQYWMPKTAITFDDKAEKALVAGSYGNIAAAAMTGQVVGKYAEGNIEGEVNINSFGLLLLALVGTETPSADDPESGVHTHAYTLQNDNIHDSLNIHVKDPDDSVNFRMAMINSLSLDVSLGEYVKYVANFISKQHQDEASQSPTYSIDNRFVHPNLTLKVAGAIDDLAAASEIRVQHLTLNIEKEAEKIDVCGSLEPEDIVNKTIRITGTIELKLEDKTWRDYMMNNTVRAMQIELVSTKTIGASSNPKLDIVFPKVHFSEWEPMRELGDISSQTINFEVMYDLANSRLWSTFDLVNTAASTGY